MLPPVSAWRAAQLETPYGSAANGTQLDRVIRIDDATRSVQVARSETVRFESDW
ncbi:MAG: hypothetical protein K2X63_01710 [Burkholderiaceae bacterium]|nr:hypothetical protein [Burkholderiaceae bacterium]